jgi:hypothetical protein
MKLVKMSLVAAMLVGASAYALDDVKVTGEAKLWYQTADFNAIDFALGKTLAGVMGTTPALGEEDMFAQASSIGDASLNINVSGKVGSAVTVNVGVTALDTLGLENNLVSYTAAGTYNADGTPTAAMYVTGPASFSYDPTADIGKGVAELVSAQWWASQANVIVNLGKTTAVLGRQALDTPLAFTEKWNVVQNTFDAAVIVNGDIPNTTLVAAYVGKENSMHGGGTVAHDGEFHSYADNIGNALGLSGTGGAYAVAAVFAGIPDTTIQGWYYNVMELATAYWLQADAKVMGMLDVGAQFANVEPDQATGADANTAYALKVAGSFAGVNVSAAYSSVSDDNLAVGFNNVSTQRQTKLYTGAGLNGQLLAVGGLGVHGFDNALVNVAAPDTDAYTIGASTAVAGVTLLGEYTSTSSDTFGDKNTWALAAATNVLGVDLLAGYTSADLDIVDVAAIRVVAGLKF